VPRFHEKEGAERNRRGAGVEKERVEQKDQKIGKYEEDGSEQVIGTLIECIVRWDRACSSRRTMRALSQGLRRLSLPPPLPF
jgi:hypothetical protein